MTSRRSTKKSSFGRDSLQSRSSISASASKLPRSTPLMHSTRKILPSHSKSTSKRSSYFASGDHHVMKDTRPLTEKAYIRKCVNEIIAFLTDMGYPHPLTPKMMNPPTNKEYFRIFEFVYGLICPNYKMVVRPEEEAAKILCDLNYPFNVSKSTLNNIGAMSAWPNACGALDWLVDLVKYCKEVEENELREMLCNGDKKQEAFNGYLQATYVAFMHGENAPFTEIDSALVDQIAEMNKDILVENEDMKTKVVQQESAKKGLLEDKASIVKMEQDIMGFRDTKEKLDKYLLELDKYCMTLQEQCNARETKLQELEEMIAKLEQANKEIQSTVTGQELSVADVQNMKIELGQIEKTIKTIEERCHQLQEQYYEKQIEQSKMIDKISNQIVDYTETCKALELIPISAQNAGGTDFSLSTDRAQLDKNVEKLLAIIRPNLIAIKSSLLKDFGKLQQERNHNATIVEQLKEQMADNKHSMDSLGQQLVRLKDEEEQRKSEFERIEEKEEKDLEKAKERIQSLKTINSLSLEEVSAQVKVEREKLKDTQSMVAKEINELHTSLSRICQACIDYKQKFKQVIVDFNISMKATTESYLPRTMECYQQLQKNQARLKKIEKELESIDKDDDVV